MERNEQIERIAAIYGNSGHIAGACGIKACRCCMDAIQAAVEWDMEDGEGEFESGFGDLIDDMHGAITALHRFRREVFTQEVDQSHNSQEAATRLVQVADAIRAAVCRGEARYS